MKIIDGVKVPTCMDCDHINKHYSLYSDVYCKVCECNFPWDAPVCVNFKQKRS